LQPLLPIFFTYVLSFVYVGIYWNNHHHLLHVCHRVDGRIMWANLHLLFWLSLFPFVTGWMGENHFHPIPSALYGAVLFMAAISYLILQRLIVAAHSPDSQLAAALGSDWKGKLSPALYATAVALSIVKPWIAGCIYIAVALLWLVPDRRLSRVLTAHKIS
jgi:uncharacterized membrane protein